MDTTKLIDRYWYKGHRVVMERHLYRGVSCRPVMDVHVLLDGWEKLAFLDDGGPQLHSGVWPYLDAVVAREAIFGPSPVDGFAVRREAMR